MSITATDYRQIKRLEELAASMGMIIKPAKFDYNTLALSPAPGEYPMYSPDFDMFAGTVSELISYLYGRQHAEMYLIQMKLTTHSKILKKEEQYRQDKANDALVEKLKFPNKNE